MKVSFTEFFKSLSVGKSTLYRSLRALGVVPTKEKFNGRHQIVLDEETVGKVSEHLRLYRVKIGDREALVRVRKWL